MKRNILYLTLTALIMVLGACSFMNNASDENNTFKKHPLDKSEQRLMTLDNGLAVLLVHDPNLNKSAASMNIGAGSLDNPADRQGLAHFLEHMLFLGTEKYPDADAYKQYLTTNGGYSNAYTAPDHTNYHFEVDHEGFEGALDRFAQFFIAPLFTAEYTEREVNAVHSEHQKNLQNDYWRSRQVLRDHYEAGHPNNMFSTGDLTTLGNISRDELIAFYETHYSANVMKLVLTSENSLDQMETWTKTYFTEIKNKNLTATSYPVEFLKEENVFRLLKIEPINDLQQLTLEFPLPDFTSEFKSKPVTIIGSLIGHEGEGSLLQYLKSQGWATSLSSGGDTKSPNYGSFGISIALTPLGLDHYKEIIELFFAYVDLLKTSDYPFYYFEEEKTMSELDQIYSNKGDGSRLASGLAAQMFYYPDELAGRVYYMFEKPDEAKYRHYLSYLKPSNFIATLMAKGVETDAVEKYYGVNYSYTKDAEFANKLSTLTSNGLFKLPAKNEFIPKNMKIPSKEVKADVSPEKIIDEAGLVLYYSDDFEFLRPKVTARFKMRFPLEMMNIENRVLLDFYTSVVKESMQSMAYPARLAGLNYSFDSGYEGVYFTISGYNQSIEKMTREMARQMKDFDVSDEVFSGIKDLKLRNIKNVSKSDAYRQARNYGEAMTNKVYFDVKDRIEVAEQITLDQLKTFAQTLYAQVFVEALVHGDYGKEEAIVLARTLTDALGSKAIPSEQTFSQTALRMEKPETLFYTDQIEVNNSVLSKTYIVGDDSPESRAAGMILSEFVGTPFFTEMRTNQQLGYIVWGGAYQFRKELAFAFIIQSAEYSADDLEHRADTFIATYPELWKALSDEDFENLRQSAINELEKKPKSIAEKAATYVDLAFEYDGDFERKAKTIEALKNIDREAIYQILVPALDKDTRKVRTVLLFPQQHEGMDKIKSSVSDLDSWKAKRIYN